jgi:hypothetical protein
MRHREVVGPLNIAASIIQKLVEAVEDAGGQEADLDIVIRGSDPKLKAVGEFIFDKSNTLFVRCREGGQSPRGFATKIGLRLDGALEKIDGDCLKDTEYPSKDSVTIRLVYPGKELSMEEAEEYLKGLGLRPATLIEILYLIRHWKRLIHHKCHAGNPLIVLGERRISEGREMFITVSTTNVCVLRLPGIYHRNEKHDKNTFWAGVEIDK